MKSYSVLERKMVDPTWVTPEGIPVDFTIWYDPEDIEDSPIPNEIYINRYVIHTLCETPKDLGIYVDVEGLNTFALCHPTHEMFGEIDVRIPWPHIEGVCHRHLFLYYDPGNQHFVGVQYMGKIK